LLISEGKCDKEIARHLGISGYTVREHIRRIFAKLNIGRRSAIVACVLR
jgi:DNA-binding CsgD family transcriptional regulator